MAKKDGSLEAGSYTAQIPEDLLIEILARVPVKSLIRFTCVCKSWLSLIKSPEFAAKQYETRTRLLLKSPCDCDNLVLRREDILIERVEALFLDYETLDVSTVFQCKTVEDHELYHNECSLYGPCKGIFCVHISISEPPDLLLWNPSTREVFRPATQSKHRSTGCHELGFGFDDNTNDFKIVTFRIRKGFPRGVKVYSLALNTWRDLEDYDYGYSTKYLVSSHTSSNGRMCNWLGNNKKACGRQFLLSFDFVDEVFIETPTPDTKAALVRQLSHHAYPALFRSDAGDVDVWVLNEYGPAGCWTKHLSVTLPDHIIGCWPIGISNDQGIIFRKRDPCMLFYYDPVNQQVKPLNVEADEVFGYTESLFSIKSYCQQPQGSDDDCDDEEMPYYFQEIPYSPFNKGHNLGFDD